MKKLLTMLTVATLSSNTGLLMRSAVNQEQTLNTTQKSDIFGPTIIEKQNLLENNSVQKSAGIVLEIIKYINNNFKELKVNVDRIQESEKAKEVVENNLLHHLQVEFGRWIMSKININFKFTDLILPKNISAQETEPGSMNITVGVKSTIEKEIVWSDVLTIKIFLFPIINETKPDNFILSTKYDEQGYSDGFSYNNILYFVNENRVFSYNQETSNADLVMQLNNKIITNGVLYNEKIYFAADDCYVYEYNPIDNQVNKIFKANDLIRSNGVVLNNKLYFGSDDHNLYQYDAKTKIAKVSLRAEGPIKHSGTAFNNRLYFGTENSRFYSYNPDTNHKWIWDNNVAVSDSGVVVNDTIYFTGNGAQKSGIFIMNTKSDNLKVLSYNAWVIQFGSIIPLNNRVFVLCNMENPTLYESVDGSFLKRRLNTTSSSLTPTCLNGLVYNNSIYLSQITDIIKFDVEKNTSEIVYKGGIWGAEIFDTCGIILNDKIYYGTISTGILEYNLKDTF